ncbi:cytochrome P450 3A24-like [Physella acuta]|uniref:cytochrome P450 3A24-like n=1 Tax=Physella acuta TaxID=109671 RepID=UPI0027DC6086|nr:cytochrome P450 3A24-like [Physella acuta]
MEDVTTGGGPLSGVTFYLLLATVTAAVYVIYNKLTSQVSWEKYGVKQVKMGIFNIREGITKLLEDHGDTVGINRGALFLVTRDLGVLREVMIKDFTNFVDRALAISTASVVERGIFFLKGNDWRRIRQIMSPSFSTGKLKYMAKTIEERAIKLTQVLEDYARQGKLVPVRDVTGQYTSEIIARTAFGLNTSSLGGPDDEFTFYSKKMLRERGKIMGIVMFFFFRFRTFHKFCVKTLKLTFLDGFWEESEVYFNTILKRSIADRTMKEKNGEKVPQDFLQSLLQAKAAGDRGQVLENTDDIDDEMSRNSVGWDKQPKTMSTEELMGQSVLVIFAGFETTSTALQMCLFLLAKHPAIQEKMCEEIERVVQGETPKYEELQQLTYVEQVINESLRLYPPASIVTRQAAETKTYGNITIPKGAGVMIPIFAVLKDPKHYPDPEKFDPDRFSEENKAKRDPMAFMPFGYGPRICIGMRLAYLELKMALATLFRKVRVEVNENTEPKKGGDIVISPMGILRTEKPVMLAFKLKPE